VWIKCCKCSYWKLHASGISSQICLLTLSLPCRFLGTWSSPLSLRFFPPYVETQTKALVQQQSPLHVPTRSKYNLDVIRYIDFEAILGNKDNTSSSSSEGGLSAMWLAQIELVNYVCCTSICILYDVIRLQGPLLLWINIYTTFSKMNYS
jgi:hypothetical protein